MRGERPFSKETDMVEVGDEIIFKADFAFDGERGIVEVVKSTGAIRARLKDESHSYYRQGHGWWCGEGEYELAPPAEPSHFNVAKTGLATANIDKPTQPISLQHILKQLCKAEAEEADASERYYKFHQELKALNLPDGAYEFFYEDKRHVALTKQGDTPEFLELVGHES